MAIVASVIVSLWRTVILGLVPFSPHLHVVILRCANVSVILLETSSIIRDARVASVTLLRWKIVVERWWFIENEFPLKSPVYSKSLMISSLTITRESGYHDVGQLFHKTWRKLREVGDSGRKNEV